MQNHTNKCLNTSALDEFTNKEVILNFLSAHLNNVKKISTVSGGLVHSVFKVETDGEIVYLKIRGDCFTGIPDIACNPNDIRHEKKSLRLLSKMLPEKFPHFIAFDKKHALLLMTSVMTEDENLRNYFNQDTLTLKILYNIGQTIARIHHLTHLYIHDPVRDDGDQEYYRNNLQYRLRFYGNPVLDSTADALTSLPRQIILGDLSPKNIGIRADNIAFCDLDSVHFGNAEFDVGFFTGHILIHSLEVSLQPHDMLSAFLKGYENVHANLKTDDPLLMCIALGICLYRLDNMVVPYHLPMELQQRKKLIKNIVDLLHDNLLRWEQVSAIFAYDK